VFRPKNQDVLATVYSTILSVNHKDEMPFRAASSLQSWYSRSRVDKGLDLRYFLFCIRTVSLGGELAKPKAIFAFNQSVVECSDDTLVHGMK
jgi:hypothetical protein